MALNRMASPIADVAEGENAFINTVLVNQPL